MNIIAVIPARMGSSRFPGKPMAKINGKPMIGHVYERTKQSKILTETYVATCDQEIFAYIHSIGGKAIMTSPSHERASDRSAEAMLKIEEQTRQKVDVVVMVQGDEPMLVPEMIDKAIEPLLHDPSLQVVNLMADIHSLEDFEDPNEVKVVVDRSNYALYFSREPIPSRKKGVTQVRMLKQVCIIPFRRDYLIHFNELTPTPLEIAESVDMMRIMENSGKILMVKTDHETVSVDTPEDLAFAESLMKRESP